MHASGDGGCREILEMENNGQKKILCLGKGLYMAGAERLELATPGFGDRCSTN